MKISSINSSSFKGVLVISNKNKNSKDFEIDTRDIIEIDTHNPLITKIQYNDENYELKQQIIGQNDEQKNRTLLAYIAAVNNDVVIKI